MKMCRRILSAAVTVVFLLSMVPAASAQTSLDIEGGAIATVASVMADKTLTPSSIEILLSLDGQPDYVLVEFSGGGYAIALRGGAVIEAAFDIDSPYKGVKGSKYYAGPLNYIYGAQGNLRTVIGNNPISDSEAQEFENKIAPLKDDVRTSATATSASRRVAGYVTNPGSVQSMLFGNNTSGTCGSVAAGIMLQYLDIYHNNNIIPAWLGHGESVHQSLIPYIEGSGGSTTMSVASGINQWRNAYSSANYTCYYVLGAHWPFVLDQINYNKPAVVGLLAVLGSPYGNHQVVAYGYDTIYDSMFYNDYYICHVGWQGGSTAAYINGIFSAGAAYINF